MAMFEMDFSELEALSQRIEEFGPGAQKIINDILHEEGGEQIKQNIQMLIPASGRSWNKKRAAASSTDALRIDNKEMLAVTIKTKPAYHYLYFPDDGTNTARHAGNQQFFLRGAEESSAAVINLCLGRLTENF